MLTTDRPTILDAVRALAPEIRARAAEVEAARRLPLDLLADLKAAGCFRALVPRSHGGAELDLPSAGLVLTELATADASVAWTVMIGASAPFILGGLPRATFDAIYAAGPDVVLAGAFNPTGVATPVPGGYRVSGQWPFASGCQHADVFAGHCFVDDGRQPPLRMMVLPMAVVQVVDTWTVAGLCGTGSHDVRAEDVFVPDERTFSIFGGEPALDGPLWRVPELLASSLMFTHVAAGIAQGALHDLVELAVDKARFTDATRLAGKPLLQHHLGEADAQLQAALALLHRETQQVWATAVAGEPFTNEQRARGRAAATWVSRTSVAIVDAAHALAGAGALYAASPLQRRLRDVHALNQHVALKEDVFTMAGAVLAGQEIDLTFL